MTTLQSVSLRAIKSNPYRDLETYPWIEHKLEVLMRSIQDVGMWEGIIARKQGKQYQIAFGHHRIESAKRLGLTDVPLIVRDLSNENMLQYMGRENSEDYHTNFLTMLHTWEAAIRYLTGSATGRSETEVITVAKLLGWVERGNSMSNGLARTCAKAVKLIQNGKLDRATLEGLSCRDARAIIGAGNAEYRKAEKHLKDSPIERDKQIAKVSNVIKDAAQAVKAGTVKRKHIDYNIYSAANFNHPKAPPEFSKFVDLTNRMLSDLHTDSTLKTRLDEIVKILPDVANDEAILWEDLARTCIQLNDVKEWIEAYIAFIVPIVRQRRKALESA